MAAHKRERKQAAVKSGNWVPRGTRNGLTLELGFVVYVGTLSSFYVVLVLRGDVVLVLRWYRFTLSSFYVGTGLRWKSGTRLGLDAVTLRGC